ncbi:MAG TPA: polysaccharide pyruvyl transferase family protein [Clostridia bacterium]|nr:polysaccharide pyruvyl transferase family protein [Clostridia bacterium]
MKIGILTYFWAENPGTFLQAFSTYKAVKKTFPNDNVEMINVKLRKERFVVAKSYLLSPKTFIKAYCRFHNYRKSIKKMNLSTGGYVGKDSKKALDYIKEQNYDVIFVGSDTIFKIYDWNIENEDLPVYYLNEINAKKVVLSGSCGSTSINEFPIKMKKMAQRCLNDFSKLGVRDNNTLELFSELKFNKNKLEIIPDPTFSYKIDLEKARKALLKEKYDFRKKTVIINLPGNFEYLDKTIEYFKNRNWNIITFNYTKYADYCLFVNPEEWAGIPYYVDLVVTDRFHGSVFSIRNNTPVVGIDMDPDRVSLNNSSKIKNLFSEYGIQESYVNFLDKPSEEEFFKIIGKTINIQVNFKDINLEKEAEYMNFLHQCL